MEIHDISSHTNSITKTIKNIVEEVQPEKIFILSTCVNHYQTKNAFIQQSIESENHSRLDMLVLSGENEMRSNDSLQDIIENKINSDGLITAIVLPIHQFNKWLLNAHPFACKIYHHAKLFYDAEKIPLAIPNVYNIEEVQKRLVAEFEHSLDIASEFLSGAELFKLRKQLPLAAFNLHQSAEQLFSAIINIKMALRLQTHNLDKLYRYTRSLEVGILEIFPRDTIEEKRLFKLLQGAYIQSRYSNDYTIKLSEINILNQRMNKLFELCQRIKKTNQIFI
jgi:HEPN domain-containing protein